MTDDGSNWISMVTDTMESERAISPRAQCRIKNALLAELLTNGINPELIDNGGLTISFPEESVPSVRIYLDPEKSSSNDKDFLSKFIANKTENGLHSDGSNNLGTIEFLRMKQSHTASITSSGGYHARCDSTISGNSYNDLVEAIGTMITNPLIKKEFLKSGPRAELS
jgi:hypothetical protein